LRQIFGCQQNRVIERGAAFGPGGFARLPLRSIQLRQSCAEFFARRCEILQQLYRSIEVNDEGSILL
jgi:hypothetical protein